MTVSHPIWLHCREVVERVSDLLGDELAADDVIRLEQHLLVCPPCSTHLQQVRSTIALAAETNPAAAVDPVAALDAFRRWKRDR